MMMLAVAAMGIISLTTEEIELLSATIGIANAEGQMEIAKPKSMPL